RGCVPLDYSAGDNRRRWSAMAWQVGKAGGKCVGVLSVVAVAVVLGMGTATAKASPPQAGQSQTRLVKYIIVPSSKNPDDVTLFTIAAATLDDGNRYPEIFKLNRGKPLPGGGTFEDPTQIEAGQVL